MLLLTLLPMLLFAAIGGLWDSGSSDEDEFPASTNPGSTTGEDTIPDTPTSGETPDLLMGTTGDDDVTLGDTDDLFYGLAGNDMIRLGSGDDTADGGDGDDTILGGAGDGPDGTE